MKKNEYNMMSNVIEEEEYRERVTAVFEDVARKLSRTLGPYGATTTLEKNGDVTFSKDGWQVLKKIQYMDPIQNTLLDLLVKISAQVNIKVGDGTTTSIVASNQLLKVMNEFNQISHLRPKDFLDGLNDAVADIVKKIHDNAIQIDKEGALDEIYDLAMVSTNGETKIAEMIRYIYATTGNPAIEFNKAKSNETSYEIVNGYKMPFMTYIDRIFINNDDGNCVLRKPLILMLNHKMEQEYYESIIQPAIKVAIEKGRKLVVMAPYYDSHLLQKFARIINAEYKATKSTSVVYVRASLMNNHMADLYNDFAALVGADILNEQTAYDILKGELEFNPVEFLGSVEDMTVGEHSTYISGFTNKNETMLKILEDDAVSKYKEAHDGCVNNSIVSEDYINLKQRVSKLKCKMGVINVGGNTELAKSANYDLVEDAVKACESSYLYGYVPGQNIAIQTAIYDLKQEITDKTKLGFLEAISAAFTNVTKILLENKFGRDSINRDTVAGMVAESVNSQEVIDINLTNIEVVKKDSCWKGSYKSLEHQENEDLKVINIAYTQNVINSCMTDIEILKAASNIIGLLISSNQYVAIRV